MVDEGGESHSSGNSTSSGDEDVEEEEEEEEVVEEEKEEVVEEEKEKDADKPPDWSKSKARDYLCGLILSGKLPDRKKIKPKAVFQDYCKNRPEFKHFQDYKALKFAEKLLRLRNQLEAKADRSKEDDAAFKHDREIFPPRTEDTKGRPVWAGSKAQELLRQDIIDGKHKEKKPKYLYETQAEYFENYELEFFQNKIYQEEKAIKREAWVIAKAEKNKKKKEGAKNKKKK